MPPTRTVRSPALDIAYEDSGRADGPAVVLLHGFPYSVRAFDAVVPILTAAGLRTIVPHLRGYGPTRFLDRDTPRSGQQGAIGQDLLDLLDALGIARAVLAGFDWGGRAACVVSALWPERVAGLASCTGYLIQDIATAAKPADPEQEHRFWYQWYFHTERGRNGLTNDRAALCRLLWRQWSPGWAFDEATLAATTALFDNPNFVDVVIHSYRHRAGNAPGDPRLAAIETRLAALPTIPVPTIAIQGASDGVNPPREIDAQRRHFSGPYQRRILPGVGHNPPQEAPAEFAAAVLDLARGAVSR